MMMMITIIIIKITIIIIIVIILMIGFSHNSVRVFTNGYRTKTNRALCTKMSNSEEPAWQKQNKSSLVK